MLRNSTTTYGGVTKTFHWLTALLVVTLIPLGIYANGLPYETGEQLARKAWMFSLHKTLGVTVFFVALARIGWALSQPKPGLLNSERKLESFLAETVHWLLYASLVLVPLSGWIHHAATTGFAPIWWPFGQSLPLVPKDDDVAHTFAALHIVFERVLAASILLHIAGALKHHVFDKDKTLRRMLPGHTDPGPLPAKRHSALPLLGAGAGYVVALAIGAAIGLFSHAESTTSPVPTLAEVETGWQVEQGTLALTVRQLGSDVQGSFENWTAAINFKETADAEGRHGNVEVQIAIASLTLGSVTAQAMGADFFHTQAHPTAVFAADILTDAEGGYFAEGTLDLKGSTQPIILPFTLQIDDDTATMTGQTRLNRTAYRIGEAYPDETSLGFDVVIDVSLTAIRQTGS
ncbi:MAG: cytochrome [Litoreibacter sp.]|nr:cytochrome [Litoreibacter sp.]